MSHSSNTWSAAGSIYGRGYLVGRGVAAGWPGRDIRHALAVRMRRGRVATEADWGLIDGLSDILILRGEVPAWPWPPEDDDADQPPGVLAGTSPPTAARRLAPRRDEAVSRSGPGRRIGFFWLRARSGRWTSWIGDLIVGRQWR